MAVIGRISVMFAQRTILAFTLAVAAPAAAQSPKGAAAPQVLSCISLANLRLVLKTAREDATAMASLINDPKSDLGCSMVDRSAVKDVTDRVTLNGQSYDCVALPGTDICHWTVAGAVSVPVPAAKPDLSGQSAPAKPKARP